MDDSAASAPLAAGVGFGHAQRSTHKAEDTWRAVLPERRDDGSLPPAGFSVFDGHGGKAAAEACCKGLLDKLLASSAPRDAEVIAATFWEVDERLGRRGVTAGTTASVLLVEDHQDIAELVYDYMEDVGYELDYAPDGEVGINLVAQNDYDAIILDLMLPRRDGLSMCRELREKMGKTCYLYPRCWCFVVSFHYQYPIEKCSLSRLISFHC